MEIVSGIIGCSFKLDSQPPNPELYVFINNQSVIEGGPDGWTYDAVANSVTFHGASCDVVRDTGIDIDVVFGCKQPTAW